MSIDYVDRLVDERNRAWEGQKALVVKAADENRELTSEERETITRTDQALDRLDGEIKEWQQRAESARLADEARADIERFVRPAAREEAKPSTDSEFLDFLRAKPGTPKAWDVDLSAVVNARQRIRRGNPGMVIRDLSVVTAAAGGTTVPTEFASTLYDYLEVFSGMRRTGSTILTTAGGEPMQFPKVTAHGTAAVVGEGSALAEADPAFGAMILGSFKYAQLIQVTSELLTDTGVDLLGFVARDLGRALGRVTDTAYVLGAGGANAPQGAMPALGTGATAVTGGTGIPSYANLIDMIYSINEEYRAQGAVWLTRDANVGAIRKLVDTTNRPLWEPSMQVGSPDRLLGYPVVTDPNVVAFATGATATASSVKSLAFGDFSAFYIRDVGGVRIERSDEYAFNTDMVTWRAILRTDSDLIDTSAIKVLIGGTV